MNITREVVTDLLPVYFSGEASGDTKALVEDYFRGDPDFERIARSAATPLDALRAAPPVAPEAQKEKRDLECVHRELWRRKAIFGIALFFLLAPLAFAYSRGHIVWMMARNAPRDAVFYWSVAALAWLHYFMWPRRRTSALVSAIFLMLFPVPFLLYPIFAGGPRIFDNAVEPAILWGAAAVKWFQYFRLRRFAMSDSSRSEGQDQ